MFYVELKCKIEMFLVEIKQLTLYLNSKFYLNYRHL